MSVPQASRLRTLLQAGSSALALILHSHSLYALEDFSTASLAQLEAQHRGQAWALVLWSVECPPCYRELENIAQLYQQQPELKLVLIAADPPDYRAEVSAVLSEFQLTELASYHFAQTDAQALRYQIDPQWFGELPRAYFYAADGQRQAHSGVVDTSSLRDWLAQD